MHFGERFNTWTHLGGLAAVLAGAGLLLARAAKGTDNATVAGLVVFCVAATALYAASVLFHSSRGAMRARWQRADHSAIYLLIAGSCTAFVLAAPASAWGIGLLLPIWALSLRAMWRELRSSGAAAPALMLYLGLGWAGVAAAVPAAASMGTPSLAWLLAGAALYTGGTVFYRNSRGWRHAHGTWHLFVLGGTASHFAALAHAVGN
jgi:hemolysin III